MLMSGRLFVDALLGQIEPVISHIDNAGIPESTKMTLRAAFCALPAFLGSVVLPGAGPLFVILSMALIYIVFNPVQDKLFGFKPSERHWLICVPVHAIYLLWAAILFWIGDINQISRTVGGVVIMTSVALWPIYMGKKKYQTKKRRISFKAAYIGSSVMVLIQQLSIIAKELFQ